MRVFKKHKGKAVPIFQPNIDTDQILPRQFLKCITKTGFGSFLFYEWRFDEKGNPVSEFILNQDRYKSASILITGRNFGSGSSREHAAWALRDFGFRVLIAPSFGEIFYNNCFKVGLLPIVLQEQIVQHLAANALNFEYFLTVNLETKQISDDFGLAVEFHMDEFNRKKLLNGWDDIDLILRLDERIESYERTRPEWMPKV
ncbi:MAG: 3-isopropylmalate dehydratase small subunit [Acidobacteria bacterium]|nr:MAG: 3-isopropylmalate dehydratase small subunit [Acidobacteriota bacterium]